MGIWEVPVRKNMNNSTFYDKTPTEMIYKFLMFPKNYWKKVQSNIKIRSVKVNIPDKGESK